MRECAILSPRLGPRRRSLVVVGATDRVAARAMRSRSRGLPANDATRETRAIESIDRRPLPSRRPPSSSSRRAAADRPTDRPTFHTFHTFIRAYVHTYYIGLCRVLYGGHVRRQHVTRCWRDVRRASRVVSSRIGRGIRAIHVAWGRGVDRARDVRDATPTPRARHHRSRPSIDRDHRSIETTDRSIGVDAALVRAGCARVRWRRRSRARRR